MAKEKILIIGSSGQVGSDLTVELKKQYGDNAVIMSDINKPAQTDGVFETIDVMNAAQVAEIIDRHKCTQVYHLAAILSAKGEQNPKWAWDINMTGLFNVLDIAKEKKLNKVFWPSSIAVFGPNTPVDNTPQHTIANPRTVYGISKLAGERWCKYYFDNYGVDVRSLRYPGLISYKTLPGGGTTDYAVDIYHQALEKGSYKCFLKPGTYLPMMYITDAIRATLELMDAPAEKVKIHSGYNVSGMSFAPEDVAAEIAKHIPGFTISYEADFRQAIADSWPNSIDDSRARNDWGWKNEFDLANMTVDMLEHLAEMKGLGFKAKA